MIAPVLVLAHRRPELARRLLETIAPARPQSLFLACDGARPDRPGESDLVAATRSALDVGIGWECRVERRYLDQNLGCRRAVESAVSWFFANVEEGIILEDDCIPSPDFLEFCSELLERYRQSERVMHIAGDNSASASTVLARSDYCFIGRTPIWGWATWRRAWDRYDWGLQRFQSGLPPLRTVYRDAREREMRARVLGRIARGDGPDTWDYIWSWSVASAGGLAIVPRVNLVQNVGHGAGATHTVDSRDSRADAPTGRILPLRHPRRVRRSWRAERKFVARAHGLGPMDALRRRVRRSGRRFHRLILAVGGRLRRQFHSGD